MTQVVRPAWNREVIYRSVSTFEPGFQARSSVGYSFEVDRLTGLLLHDLGWIAKAATADDIAYPDLDDVAAAQLAVDRETEQGAVSHSAVFVEEKANGPDPSEAARAENGLPTFDAGFAKIADCSSIGTTPAFDQIEGVEPMGIMLR